MAEYKKEIPEMEYNLKIRKDLSEKRYKLEEDIMKLIENFNDSSPLKVMSLDGSWEGEWNRLYLRHVSIQLDHEEEIPYECCFDTETGRVSDIYTETVCLKPAKYEIQMLHNSTYVCADHLQGAIKGNITFKIINIEAQNE